MNKKTTIFWQHTLSFLNYGQVIARKCWKSLHKIGYLFPGSNCLGLNKNENNFWHYANSMLEPMNDLITKSSNLFE